MRGVSVGDVAERLRAKTVPDKKSSCWIWVGHVKKNGYGAMSVKDNGAWKTKVAHRLWFEVAVGPIPAGLDLDHKCRNRRCVNPGHLEPVTRSENLRRSPLMSLNHHSRAKQHCPAGHPYSGKNIRGQRICHLCQAETQRRHRNRKGRK